MRPHVIPLPAIGAGPSPEVRARAEHAIPLREEEKRASPRAKEHAPSAGRRGASGTSPDTVIAPLPLLSQLASLENISQPQTTYISEKWLARKKLMWATSSSVYHLLDVGSDVLLVYNYFQYGYHPAGWSLLAAIFLTTAIQVAYEIVFNERVRPLLMLASVLQVRVFVEWVHFVRVWRVDWKRADFRGGVRIFEAFYEASISPIIQLAVLIASREISFLRVVALITSTWSSLHVAKVMIPIMKGQPTEHFGTVEGLFAFTTSYDMIVSWCLFGQFFSTNFWRGFWMIGVMLATSTVCCFGLVFYGVHIVRDPSWRNALSTWGRQVHFASSFIWMHVYPMPMCNYLMVKSQAMLPWKGHCMLALKGSVQIMIVFVILVVTEEPLFGMGPRAFLYGGTLALALKMASTLASVCYMRIFLAADVQEEPHLELVQRAAPE